MRNAVVLVEALLLLLVTRAVAEDTKPPTQTSPEVLAILADVLPAEAYAETDHCISTRNVRRVDVLDSGHVLFVTRREAWLNRLAMKCTGLRPGSLLEFEQYGSRLCQHDTMLARERGIDFREDFPPRCRLGRFERVELQQAEMLREQFRQLRKACRSSPPEKAEPITVDKDSNEGATP